MMFVEVKAQLAEAERQMKNEVRRVEAMELAGKASWKNVQEARMQQAQISRIAWKLSMLESDILSGR